MPSSELTVDQVILRRGGAPAFVHSIRVHGGLTMRYWDYLAWAVARIQPRRMLVVGLGGGTMLQLIEHLGVTPPCLALDLDPALTRVLRDAGWLTYPQLEVRHEDARAFLVHDQSREPFDAIVIDVYDEHGYVEELYDDRLLGELAARLTPGGALVFHCLDPMAKFPSLRVLMPTPPPSPSCTVARDLVALGMTASIYPLWTSALVIGTRDPRTLGRLASGGATDPAQVWLDEFYARRRLSLTALTRFVSALEGERSYDHLERLDRAAVATLAMAGGAELRRELGIPAPRPDDPPADVRELASDGERPLTQGTLRAALALKALIERTAPGDPASAPYVQAIRVAAGASDNAALRGVASFAHAWAGDFPAALAALRAEDEG